MRIKHSIISALLIIAIFVFCVPAAVHADEYDSKTPDILKESDLEAFSVVLVDSETGAVLFEKNAHTRMYPASTTKLMTALLTIENTAMNDIVTFSYDSVHNIEASSSRIGIDEGEELTVDELAERAGTCMHDIISCIGPRVERVYFD